MENLPNQSQPTPTPEVPQPQPTQPEAPLSVPTPRVEFKPNIYPIIYWALAYGLAGGVFLFLITILANFISILWVPVFIVGLVWGGYRNYSKQKAAWGANNGAPLPKQSPVNEFKQAVSDIATASQELFNQESQQAPPTDNQPEGDQEQSPPTPPVV